MRRSRKEIVIAGVALVALTYVASYLALKNAVLKPYERRLTADQHWLRPSYNIAYYPLRWLSANGWSPVPPSPTIERGKIDSISERNVTLEVAGGSILSIGFTASADVLESIKGFSAGDSVEVGLGTALFEDYDMFMNRLLYIRKVQR